MSETNLLWQLTQGSVWEFILRALIVYGAVLFLLRLGGKREIGQIAPFDLVLLLLISNAVQNSMNGGDNSITAGLILAISLVGINYLIGLIVAKNKKAAAIIEGQPQILVHNGQLYHDALRRANLSLEDLKEAMHLDGHYEIKNLHYAILEINGRISFKEKSKHRQQVGAGADSDTASVTSATSIVSLKKRRLRLSAAVPSALYARRQRCFKNRFHIPQKGKTNR